MLGHVRPTSQTQVAARGRVQRLGRSDVAVDEDVDTSVSGLGSDLVDADACHGGGGGMPGAQRVGGDAAGQSCGGGGVLDEVGDDVTGDRLPWRGAVAEAGEHRAGCPATHVEPCVQGADRVGAGMLSWRNADDLAVGFGVGLRTAQAQQQPGRLALDISKSETSKL